MLNAPTAMVTGGSGFVGGRLVERLILYHRARVRALVRKLGHASRLARFDLDLVPGHFADETAVDEAVASCDFVFHCAHDWYDNSTNLEGARLIAQACLRHGVKRLVYVSSMAVYGWPEGSLDESREPTPDTEYGRNKLEVERLLLRYAREERLPVVILEPGCVYGPYSQAWTVGQVTMMRLGRIVLPDGGQGLCNGIYIDDLVDAMLLAAEKNAAVGERFLISDEEPVPWRAFFGAYEQILGKPGVVLKPIEEVETLVGSAKGVRSLKRLWANPRQIAQWRPVRALYHFLKRRVSRDALEKIKGKAPPARYTPNPEFLKVYTCNTRACIDKAKNLLGYQPRFGFERGMRLTGEFIKRTSL